MPLIKSDIIFFSLLFNQLIKINWPFSSLAWVSMCGTCYSLLTFPAGTMLPFTNCGTNRGLPLPASPESVKERYTNVQETNRQIRHIKNKKIFQFSYNNQSLSHNYIRERGWKTIALVLISCTGSLLYWHIWLANRFQRLILPSSEVVLPQRFQTNTYLQMELQREKAQTIRRSRMNIDERSLNPLTHTTLRDCMLSITKEFVIFGWSTSPTSNSWHAIDVINFNVLFEIMRNVRRPTRFGPWFTSKWIV